MNKAKKSVLSAITTAVNSCKGPQGFTPSDAATKLFASGDILGGSAKVMQEKTAYDAANTVSPLHIVVFAAVSASLAQCETEDEARTIARNAVSNWLVSKGLRSLSAAQVVRAANGKQEEGDMPIADIKAIAKAWMNRDKEGATLKSVKEIIAHFKLADTSAQAFNMEQANLRKLATDESPKVDATA